MANFNEKDFVKVKQGAFSDAWVSCGHKNEWVIDHIRTSVNKKQPTLYVCRPINGITLYRFVKEELELL